MRNSVQRPPAQHWPVCALLCVVALACVIFIGAVCLTAPLSIHRDPPADQITALTQQTQYPVGTENIVIRVTNQGDYSGEIQKPYLETERDGIWYIVKRPASNETLNLLGVSPGGTAEWEIPLSSYGLAPGRYRAVFDFVQEDGYFAFQFDIVDTSP